MNKEVKEIRDKIILSTLPHVAFDGWSNEVLTKGAKDCGYDQDMVNAVFINGLKDAVEHFSHWADEEMLKKLSSLDNENMSIREKIFEAVSTRLNILYPHREAVKMGLAYWGIPLRGIRAGKTLWASADTIWIWAGDKSTDYNRYTKRLILSTVIASTMLYWLQDESKNTEDSFTFLKRKIENVVKIGKFIGSLKNKIA